MLVLSRRENETIVINGSIKVTVVEINRGKVRLGIEADSAIPVYRGEVWEKISEGRKHEEVNRAEIH